MPIDFSTESTRALKFAVKLARREGGHLTLVHIVGPIYDLRDYGYGPVQRRRANEGLVRHAMQRLRALGRRYAGDKMGWRQAVQSGTAPRQILKASEEFESDLILMPTRGLSQAPPLEVGSTAERSRVRSIANCSDGAAVEWSTIPVQLGPNTEAAQIPSTALPPEASQCP